MSADEATALWRRRLAMPAVLFAIVVLFNWKLVLTNQYTWLEGQDIATQVLPWFQFQAGEWHHGRIPLWDPTGWMGQPLFGQGQPGSAFPPNWLLFLMPLKHGWMRQDVLHWYYVLARYLAALTAYALCRELGCSRAASVLGGCLYALGGYLGNTDFPQMVNGALCSPLVLLYLLRAERGVRPWSSSLLSGFFLGIGWLAGHHQVNVFVSLATVGLWAWLCVRHGKMNWKMAKLAAASLIVAALASGLQTLPTAEYARLAVRWVGVDHPQTFNETVPYTIHSEYALKPVALLGIFIPGVETRSIPYVGIAGFLLALAGVALAWSERRVRWLAVVALGAILFALGPNSLLHGVLYALAPLVEKSRVPGAAAVVFSLALAPLAAFGLDALPRPEHFAWSRRAGFLLWGVCTVLSLSSLIFFAANIKNEIYGDRMMVTALAAAVTAIVLAGWRTGLVTTRAGTATLIALALFELANVTNYQLPNRAVPEQNPLLHLMSENSDLRSYLRARGEQARVEVDDQAFPYAVGDWWGVETMLAPGPSALSNVWRSEIFSPRGRDFYGVRFYLASKPNREKQIDAFAGTRGLHVFENISAFPRVWSVHQTLVAPPPEVMPRFRDPALDLRRTVILAKAPQPALSACPPDGDEVEMPVHDPNYVRIQARMGCRGMVILTDSFFPGWRATVDGRAAAIVEAYGAVRGVAVDGGAHVIEMRYRPFSVMLGAGMTMVALALVLWTRFARSAVA